MSRTILDKYPKEKLNILPQVSFPGRIEVVLGENEAERAVNFLLQQPILGFDTETRPSFKKGKMNMVSLLQVSTHDICFLFRLCQIGLPPCVQRLLEDREVKKVALSWKDDIAMLQKRIHFHTGTFIELQHVVREFGIQDQSLQKLYANLFEQRISKQQRLSNWEIDVLKDAQKRYAATDAWACIMIYEELMRLKRNGYSLIKSINEETQED